MDFYQFILLSLGVGLGFYAQTIVGFAASLIAYPFLLQVLPFQQAVAIMTTFYTVFSAIFIYKNWRDIDKKIVLELFWSTFVGLVIGTYILTIGSPIILKKLLGVFVLIFVSYSLFKQKKFNFPTWTCHVFGFFGGLLSGLFSAGGPSFVFYLYSKIDKAKTLRATTMGAFAVTNSLRLPLQLSTGILTWEIFLKSCYMLPIFFLAMYLGQKSFNRINEKMFKKVLMLLLFITGISLIVG